MTSTRFTIKEFNRLYGVIRNNRALLQRQRSYLRRETDPEKRRQWERDIAISLDQISRAAACLHVDCNNELQRMCAEKS